MPTIFACSCGRYGSFEEAIESTPILAHVKVIETHEKWSSVHQEYLPISAKLEVVKVLKGKLSNKIIKISSSICPKTIYVESMEKGVEYIFPLNSSDYNNYHLISCSQSGAIVKNSDSYVHDYEYDEIKEELHEVIKFFMKYDQFIEKYRM